METDNGLAAAPLQWIASPDKLDVPPITPDGPLSRWVLTKSRPLTTIDIDQAKIEEMMGRFRKARTNLTSLSGQSIAFDIDYHRGYIELLDAMSMKYTARVDFGGIRILENYGPPIDDQRDTWLEMHVFSDIPHSVADSLAGKVIDEVIELPETLQTIITGRVITAAHRNSQFTTLRLDRANW